MTYSPTDSGIRNWFIQAEKTGKRTYCTTVWADDLNKAQAIAKQLTSDMKPDKILVEEVKNGRYCP